jgi:hypothetical protein
MHNVCRRATPGARTDTTLARSWCPRCGTVYGTPKPFSRAKPGCPQADPLAVIIRLPAIVFRHDP